MSLPSDTAMDSDEEFVILDSPATEQNNRMRRKIWNMAKQVDTLMVEMNAQARQSKTENDKLHTTAGELLAAVQAGKDEKHDLHIKVGNLKAMVYEMLKAAEASDQQAKKLHKYIENLDGEHEETRQQLRHLVDDVKGDNVVKRLEACMENVDVDHVQTIHKLDKLSDDNKDLHETITTLRNDNVGLRAKMVSMEEKLTALSLPTRDEEVNQLRARIEKLESMKLPALIKGHVALKKNVHDIEQSVTKHEQKTDAHQAKFKATENMLASEFGARNKMHSDLAANVEFLKEASTTKFASLADKIDLLDVGLQTAEEVEIATHHIVKDLAEQLKNLNPSTAPPLSILEGLQCQRDGAIVNEDGKPVGRIFKGDFARVYRRQYKCDANGEFHRTDGGVVARAQTLTLVQSEVHMAIKEQKAGQEHSVLLGGFPTGLQVVPKDD